MFVIRRVFDQGEGLNVESQVGIEYWIPSVDDDPAGHAWQLDQ